MSTPLFPWTVRPVPTSWVSSAPTIDLGAPPLAGILEAARRADVGRIMLVGPALLSDWLLGELPEGWQHGAHHLDHATPVGRYVTPEGRKLEVRRAAEWFGEGSYSVPTARAAWDDLAAALAAAVPGAQLLGSPGATGREAWLRSLPRDADGRTIAPAQVDAEVAELLRATSGQHRIELFPRGGVHHGLTTTDVAGALDSTPSAPATMHSLYVLDGRLMYAACLGELGVADNGARWLTAGDAAQLLELEPYARARYLVRATVPTDWHTLGLLPYAEEGAEVWSYPRERGRTFETWCDAAEAHLAVQWGWKVEPQTAILWGKGRPLDTWRERILRAYNRVDANQLGLERASMVRAGLRWMLLHSVGAWHSSGRTETTVTESAMQRPPGDGWGAPQRTPHGAVWRRRVPLDGRAAAMAHPEYSAQIWGRARARVLSAPTAERGVMAGALYVDPASLVSIYGDAVMTTTAPHWADARYDDGRPGRLRLKGHLSGPLEWPTTARDRDRLMHAAEAATKGEK